MADAVRAVTRPEPPRWGVGALMEHLEYLPQGTTIPPHIYSEVDVSTPNEQDNKMNQAALAMRPVAKAP